jgi:hypothetical protein
MTRTITKSINRAELASLALAVLPACILGYLVLKYGVNVPFGDQWDTPGALFEKIGNRGSISLADLLSQHNESRKFFPRLFFLGLAHLTHWNVQYEMLSSFVLACLISLNIYKLSQITLQKSQMYLLLLLSFANLIIFSPAQYENWLWGIQIIAFIPIFSITSCLLVAHSHLKIWTKLLICCAFSILSTFSYANGLLCWIAFLPMFIFSADWQRLKYQGKGLFILAWLSAFLVNIGIYFHDYHKPPLHPSFTEVLVHPVKAFFYFCSFLGSPLAGGSLTIAFLTGFCLISVFTVLCIYLLWQIHQRKVSLFPIVGWITIGAYSIVSGLITTAGRLGFGIEQSMVSRYTTFSGYLIVSIVYLSVISSNLWNERQLNSSVGQFKSVSSREISSTTVTVLITAIVTLHLVACSNFVSSMDKSWYSRAEAQACLRFINFVDDACITESLYPKPAIPKQRISAIQKLGFIETKVATTPVIHPAKREEGEEYGAFDSLQPLGKDQYVASGWAILPEKERAADAVLLTYKDEQGRAIVFAVAATGGARQDVSDSLKIRSYFSSGWRTIFSTKNLPPRELRIQAWAFDIAEDQSFELIGSSLFNLIGPSLVN